MTNQPKWHPVGTVTQRYELRRGSEVLTEVSYSRSDGVWRTARTSGFIHCHNALRHEERRLGLPLCYIAEVKP